MTDETVEKKPLSTETIEALAPVTSLMCADTISTYLVKRAARDGPAMAIPTAAKVHDCLYSCRDKIKAHPECNAIMESFRACLAKGKRVPCQPLKAALEECAVRNFRDDFQ